MLCPVQGFLRSRAFGRNHISLLMRWEVIHRTRADTVSDRTDIIAIVSKMRCRFPWVRRTMSQRSHSQEGTAQNHPNRQSI